MYYKFLPSGNNENLRSLVKTRVVVELGSRMIISVSFRMEDKYSMRVIELLLEVQWIITQE